jgi:hypothetical protein
MKGKVPKMEKPPPPPPCRSGEFCKKCGERTTERRENYWLFTKWECNSCGYVSTYIL